MKKILVVEDELAIAKHIAAFLKKDNYNVKLLHSGQFVTDTVKSFVPDLVILDVMLPDKDGITCCKQIREFSDVPVMILTAKVEEIERVIGLQAGADDYVCKPFSAVELMLRIKAILKRSNKPVSTGVISLNTESYVLTYQNNQCELSHLEFVLFNLLYQKPGRIYARNQIIDLVYPNSYEVHDRAIDSHIKNIRKKIKSLGIDSTVIDAVYGAGYRYLIPENK
jgi:two-component system response regulator BaeR